MEIIHVNSLVEKSKEKKKEKLYEEERKILEEAHRIDCNNLKVLNALLRNIRKTGTIEEQYEILFKIYKLNPNSNVLYELIMITRKMGKIELEMFFLEEKLRFDKEDSKVLKRLKSITITPQKEENSRLLKPISKDQYLELGKIREIIYSDLFMEDIKKIVLDLALQFDEDYQAVLFAELYKHVFSQDMAKKFVKEYKKKAENDEKKTKLANILMELVQSKKTNQINWNDFWLKNRNIKDEKNNLTLSK